MYCLSVSCWWLDEGGNWNGGSRVMFECGVDWIVESNSSGFHDDDDDECVMSILCRRLEGDGAIETMWWLVCTMIECWCWYDGKWYDDSEMSYEWYEWKDEYVNNVIW